MAKQMFETVGPRKRSRHELAGARDVSDVRQQVSVLAARVKQTGHKATDVTRTAGQAPSVAATPQRQTGTGRTAEAFAETMVQLQKDYRRRQESMRDSPGRAGGARGSY